LNYNSLIDKKALIFLPLLTMKSIMVRRLKRYLGFQAAIFSFCFFTFKLHYGLPRIDLATNFEENTIKSIIPLPEYVNLQVTNESKLIKKVKKLPECILIGAAKSGKKFKRI
jgi:hypothetical protein